MAELNFLNELVDIEEENGEFVLRTNGHFEIARVIPLWGMFKVKFPAGETDILTKDELLDYVKHRTSMIFSITRIFKDA